MEDKSETTEEGDKHTLAGTGLEMGIRTRVEPAEEGEEPATAAARDPPSSFPQAPPSAAAPAAVTALQPCA